MALCLNFSCSSRPEERKPKGFPFAKERALIKQLITLNIIADRVEGFSCTGNTGIQLFGRAPLVVRMRLSEDVGIYVMLLQKVVQIGPVLPCQLCGPGHIPFGHLDQLD